jgi:hypothetical protein
MSAKLEEQARTSKTLTWIGFWNNLSNINYLESASQAYDEGSIPFTRSNDFNDLEDFPHTPSDFLAQYHSDFLRKADFSA